jgi:hypothetical protein
VHRCALPFLSRGAARSAQRHPFSSASRKRACRAANSIPPRHNRLAHGAKQLPQSPNHGSRFQISSPFPPPRRHCRPARPLPQTSFIYKTALRRFGPRLFVTCGAWVVNDVAFYVSPPGRAQRPRPCPSPAAPRWGPGLTLPRSWRSPKTRTPNPERGQSLPATLPSRALFALTGCPRPTQGNKLFQSRFIAALYPKATPFERMQWTVLNSFIALLGYWLAAAWVDKSWYGRRRMQVRGPGGAGKGKAPASKAWNGLGGAAATY